MIGNYAVHIRVKVPNLLISSNLRELVGGGLCSKGAERPGKVTIENQSKKVTLSSKSRTGLKNGASVPLSPNREVEEDCVFFTVFKSSRGRRRVFCSATVTSTSTTSRGVPATCSCWVLATNTHLEKASSCGEEWSGGKVGSCFVLPSPPFLAQVVSRGAPGGSGPCQP